MKTQQWTTIVKAAWGAGDWQDEPDKKQWPDAVTGLPCLAVRHQDNGHWCGYVGVPPEHPWHGKSYNAVAGDVHGGLTFADACADSTDPSRHVCHVADPGEPEHVWWFGFDCHHAWDFAPGMYARYRDDPILGQRADDEVYRSLAYVERECADLARQLAAPTC